VVANEHQLGQVFLNLLLNAAHAVEEAGRADGLVTVALGTAPAGWARVEVRDNGGGIPPHVLPHIFEPFFTTRGLGSGTGLGLAIAAAEVVAAGGRIEVESAVGHGTTFRVLLPPAPPGARLPARVEAPAATPPSGTPGLDLAPARRPKALVVDDDPLVARSIVRVLGRAFDVVTVESGAAALERLDAGPCEVVVCDLMMPGMTGMELHAQVAARHAAQAARFVFVTGGVFTDAARRFLESSTAPCVEKPFEPARLRQVVEQVARGEQPAAA
jgi:CheY-like chemotaxis protein